jgi:phosphoribosylaminoimidazole-succinocarboxamide synthase
MNQEETELDKDLLYPAFQQAFTASSLPFPCQKGKVRDVYRLAPGRLLMVTTDRLSAFDRILGAAPFKGQVLNQLSAWWFEQTKPIVTNHALELPDPNALIAQQAEPFPVEVIVRGYITGVTSTALWHRYNLGERVIYGHKLPDGLRKNQALPEPIITPTTKGGPTGHDERLTPAEVVEKGYLDAKTWDSVQKAALELFAFGQKVAARAGLILVDTKYEFGRDQQGEICLIDEVHTPDSSRYWLDKSYIPHFEAGNEPENYDKEYLRLIYAQHGYRGEGEPPPVPEDLWLEIGQRYIDLYERLTGQAFIPAVYPVPPRLEANLVEAGVLGREDQ